MYSNAVVGNLISHDLPGHSEVHQGLARMGPGIAMPLIKPYLNLETDVSGKHWRWTWCSQGGPQWVKLTTNFPSDTYVQALLLGSLEEAWE